MNNTLLFACFLSEVLFHLMTILIFAKREISGAYKSQVLFHFNRKLNTVSDHLTDHK